LNDERLTHCGLIYSEIFKFGWSVPLEMDGPRRLFLKGKKIKGYFHLAGPGFRFYRPILGPVTATG
jgi:hypothetical protein